MVVADGRETLRVDVTEDKRRVMRPEHRHSQKRRTRVEFGLSVAFMFLEELGVNGLVENLRLTGSVSKIEDPIVPIERMRQCVV